MSTSTGYPIKVRQIKVRQTGPVGVNHGSVVVDGFKSYCCDCRKTIASIQQVVNIWCIIRHVPLMKAAFSCRHRQGQSVHLDERDR